MSAEYQTLLSRSLDREETDKQRICISGNLGLSHCYKEKSRRDRGVPREGLSGKVTCDTLEEVKEGAMRQAERKASQAQQGANSRSAKRTENLAPGPCGTEF